MRYVEASTDVYDILHEVIDDRFNTFSSLTFKLLFDTKKKLSRGKIVLATTEVVNDKVRFLSISNDTPDGYDYIIIIDQVAWEYASNDDKKRLISHELNHVFIDEKGKLRVVGHDVEDFQLEINRNIDNADWAYNLSTLVSSIYDQKDDQN